MKKSMQTKEKDIAVFICESEELAKKLTMENFNKKEITCFYVFKESKRAEIDAVLCSIQDVHDCNCNFCNKN